MSDEINLKKCPNCGHAGAVAWKHQSDRWISATINCHTCGYEIAIRRFINDRLGEYSWDTDWEINGLNDNLSLDIKDDQIEIIVKIVEDLAPMFPKFQIYSEKPANHYCGVCHNPSLIPSSGEFMVCPNGHYKIRTWKFLVKFLEMYGYQLIQDHETVQGYTFQVYKNVVELTSIGPFKVNLPRIRQIANLWLGPTNVLVFSKPDKYSPDEYQALLSLLKSRKDSIFTAIEKKE